MLKNGVYILRKDATPMKDVEFKEGQELEVVGNVIYMGGFPLPLNMQNAFNKWMVQGMKDRIFINDTRG